MYDATPDIHKLGAQRAQRRRQHANMDKNGARFFPRVYLTHDDTMCHSPTFR